MTLPLTKPNLRPGFGHDVGLILQMRYELLQLCKDIAFQQCLREEFETLRRHRVADFPSWQRPSMWAKGASHVTADVIFLCVVTRLRLL
eukprot:m.210543 g.210543  ORF g.210543 m.210543 type:complete len:89 (-) comp17144_c0_seq6:2613-2879(-)